MQISQAQVGRLSTSKHDDFEARLREQVCAFLRNEGALSVQDAGARWERARNLASRFGMQTGQDIARCVFYLAAMPDTYATDPGYAWVNATLSSAYPASKRLDLLAALIADPVAA